MGIGIAAECEHRQLDVVGLPLGDPDELAGEVLL
jgi:hypothetical protein